MNEKPNQLVVTHDSHLEDLGSVFQLAEAIVPSGMLPDHIRSPGAAVATILAGRELGLAPMAALRTIYLVKGKVVIGADAQLALVHQAGWKSHWIRSDMDVAVLELSRDDSSHKQSFSLKDAKQAGLAGKDNWKKHPAAMLRARCISAAVKAACPEVLMGCYTPDEVEGFRDDSSVVPVASKGPTRHSASNGGANIMEATEEASNGPEAFRKHHGSFKQDQPRFMARISDLGWKYAELCDFLASLDKPRPSAMAQDARDALVNWLGSNPPQVTEWMQNEATGAVMDLQVAIEQKRR